MREYEHDRRTSYVHADAAMQEIARRGFAINPLVFGVFYNLASGDDQGVAADLAAIESSGRFATQAEVHQIAQRRLFGDKTAAIEALLAQLEVILKLVGDKMSEPVGVELEAAVRSMVAEVGGQNLPPRVRQAMAGVMRSAKAVTDRDRSVVENVRKGVDEITALQKELDLARRERDQAILEARSDQLTGVSNRRAFNERMATVLRGGGGLGRTTSLIMLDIDRFKNINDQYGHDFGDEVLKEVARRTEQAVGSAGSLFRLGGEEFCILLEGMDLEAARKVGERIRMAVGGSPVPESVGSGPQVQVTVSCGITERRVHDTQRSFMHRADKCLYRAKDLGRDRVFALA